MSIIASVHKKRNITGTHSIPDPLNLQRLAWRSGKRDWLSISRCLSGMGLNTSKESCCFLQPETLLSLLSTGLLYQWIWKWLTFISRIACFKSKLKICLLNSLPPPKECLTQFHSYDFIGLRWFTIHCVPDTQYNLIRVIDSQMYELWS